MVILCGLCLLLPAIYVSRWPSSHPLEKFGDILPFMTRAPAQMHPLLVESPASDHNPVKEVTV